MEKNLNGGIKMKKNLRTSLVLLLILLVTVAFVGCNSSVKKGDDQTNSGSKLEGKIIGIACLPTGSTNQVLAEAMATTITQNSPLVARTEPSSGPASWLGTLERGEIEFGIASDYDIWKAFEGDTNIYDKVYKNIRMVKMGDVANKASLVVAKDSSIKSIQDLVGKKVGVDIPAQPSLQAITEAFIVGAGISLDDIQRVKIESMADGLRALAEGRVDATLGTLGSGAVEEMNATKGARFLPTDNSPEGLARAREIFPGLNGTMVQAGPTGVNEDTPFYGWGVSLITSENIPEEIIYEVTKVLFENYDTFKDYHPGMKAYAPEFSLSVLTPIPMHEGSIKYYKEAQVWKEDMEKRHNELLKLSN